MRHAAGILGAMCILSLDNCHGFVSNLIIATNVWTNETASLGKREV